LLAIVLPRMGVEMGDIFERLSHADRGLYLAALVFYYLTFPVRAFRWRKLLRNVGFLPNEGVRLPSIPAITEIIMLSWFANCVVPAKLGDAYRAYLLKRSAGVSFSKTFGTILAERMIDMLMLFALLAGSVLLAFRGALPAVILGIMEVGLLLVGVAIVGLVAMRTWHRKIARLVPRRFRDHYRLFTQGTLGSFRSMPLVLTYSLASWGIEAGRLYLVCLSLGLTQLSPPIVLFVALASALLTTLPITPAGLGFVESAIVGILLLAAGFGLAPGVDENVATSVAILDRTISYWSLILVGFTLYVFTRKK
jgi:glycosyltransferase 2 family protein